MSASRRRRLARTGAAVALSGAIALSSAAVASAAVATPTVTTGALRSVLPTSAVVNGTVDPNGVATTWYFQYGLAVNATFGARTAAKSAGAGRAEVSVTGMLTGLAPATSYRYRLVAETSAGAVFAGTGVFNTTAAPIVVTGAATRLGSNSATLNGTVDPEGLAGHWYFQYGTSTSYGSATAVTALVAGPSADVVAATVTDLAPDMTYHFRLVSTSSAGETFGNDLLLSTGRSVTLNASSSEVVYGGALTLTGTVANAQPGDQVSVRVEPYDRSSFAGVGQTVTGAGGTWELRVTPAVRSTYEAVANGGTSSPTVVSVSPAVALSVARTGRLSTTVVAATSFASHVLQLQRLNGGLWVTWKHVLLDARSTATFFTQLPRGRTTIRMAIGPFVVGINQSAPGYLAGYSRAVSYDSTR